MFNGSLSHPLNDRDQEQWLKDHTLTIPEWRCYCLANCMGTYLTYRFLMNTLNAKQEELFIKILNQAYQPNKIDENLQHPTGFNKNEWQFFLAEQHPSTVGKLTSLAIVKHYKSQKQLDQSVFYNINNKMEEATCLYFFDNLFGIDVFKVPPKHSHFMIVDQDEASGKNDSGISTGKGILIACTGVGLLFLAAYGIFRLGKYLKGKNARRKAYRQVQRENDERWTRIVRHINKENTIALTDHNSNGARVEHFNLLLRDKEIAKNHWEALFETDLSMAYTLSIPSRAKKIYRGGIDRKQSKCTGFSVPDKENEPSTNGTVYSLNVKYYETQSDLEERQLPKNPVLLVMRDTNNYFLWGKPGESDDFQRTPLEFTSQDKAQLNHWTNHQYDMHFNLVLDLDIARERSIFTSLTQAHKFLNNQSEALLFIKARYYKMPENNSDRFLENLAATLRQQQQPATLIKVQDQYYMWGNPGEKFSLTAIQFDPSNRKTLDRWITQKYQRPHTLKIPYKGNRNDEDCTTMFASFQPAHAFNPQSADFTSDTIIYNLELKEENQYVEEVAIGMREYLINTKFTHRYHQFRSRHQQSMETSHLQAPLPGLSPIPRSASVDNTLSMIQDLTGTGNQITTARQHSMQTPGKASNFQAAMPKSPIYAQKEPMPPPPDQTHLRLQPGYGPVLT